MALRRQLRAIGGISRVGPDPKVAATELTPILRPAPDRQECRAAPRSYVRESVAICYYVSINGRNATHVPLLYVRTRLCAEEEPQVEVALAVEYWLPGHGPAFQACSQRLVDYSTS